MIFDFFLNVPLLHLFTSPSTRPSYSPPQKRVKHFKKDWWSNFELFEKHLPLLSSVQFVSVSCVHSEREKQLCHSGTLQWKATKIFPLWNVISLCFSRAVICSQYSVKCKNHSQEIEKSPDANFLFEYNAEVAFCYSKKCFH